MPAIDRVEIGYTWYAARWQRSHVNTACKLLLLSHAFEALGCAVVGFRTDAFNFASQRALAALGARKDGVIRHHQARRDGSVRDTVFFSIVKAEWPDVKKHLALRLARRGSHALGHAVGNSGVPRPRPRRERAAVLPRRGRVIRRRIDDGTVCRPLLPCSR